MRSCVSLEDSGEVLSDALGQVFALVGGAEDVVKNESESVSSFHELSFSDWDVLVEIGLWNVLILSDTIIQCDRNVIRVL